MKLNGRASVVLLVAACLGGCGDDPITDPPLASWSLALDELPGALISVWGDSETNVWAVGGNPSDRSGAMVIHWDGTGFKRIASETPSDLWWVHGFSDGPLFMAGSNGTILRYENDVFTPLSTPGDGLVFGIWGSSPTDLWAVGSHPTEGGFVWRSDGGDFRVAEGLPTTPISHYFKVWGKSASDVRIVGVDGIILHYNGSEFTSAQSPTRHRMLTVFAEPDGPWVAAGGTSDGVLIEDSGAGWTDVSPSEFNQPLIGVRTAGDQGYAVGNNGSVARKVDGSWQKEETELSIFGDLHAVYLDPAGGVWTVGGAIAGPPLIDGVLAYKGVQAGVAGPYTE